MRIFWIALVVIAAATPAHPQMGSAPTGSAQGRYGEQGRDQVRPIGLAYAVALRKDDAALGEDAGIWVLLSDRPVAATALSGGIFPRAIGMAKAGAFEGILFVVSDKDRDALTIRVLSRTRNPEGAFETLTLSGTEVWKSLSIKPGSISGTLERDSVRFSFDTPITEDPVLQDVKAPAARDTPVGRTLLRNIEAWIAGDMAGLEATVSKRRLAELQALPAEVRKQLLAGAKTDPDLAKSRTISRITVRAATATATTPAGSYDLVREDNVWKVD